VQGHAFDAELAATGVCASTMKLDKTVMPESAVFAITPKSTISSS
jgi:hypothetical protein